MSRSEVLVGIDTAPAAVAALHWAADHALRTESNLRAVHALSWPFGAAVDLMTPEEAQDLSLSQLDRVYRATLIRLFDSVRVRPDWVLQFAHGDAGPVLVEQARHAALLVVGAPSHVGLGRLVAGSVGHYVLTHARCPVVAVPNAPSPEVRPAAAAAQNQAAT
jgi:nucleotide-binding universal stress UspA family protein